MVNRLASHGFRIMEIFHSENTLTLLVEFLMFYSQITRRSIRQDAFQRVKFFLLSNAVQ